MRTVPALNFELLQRFVLVLLVVLAQAVLSSCTETVHASIWVEVPLSNEATLMNTLASSGWAKQDGNSSAEVIFRNAALPNCFIRKGSPEKNTTELVFVKVGAKVFRAEEATAYQRLTIALAAAFGRGAVRSEAIDAV